MGVGRRLIVGGAGTWLALLALPLFLIFDLPVAGWAIGAGAVVANRLLGALTAWSVRDSSTTMVLGVMGFSMIFRALGTALALFFVGAEVGAAGGRAVGFNRPDLALPAIIVFILCYTVDAAVEALRRASDREHPVSSATVPVETSR